MEDVLSGKAIACEIVRNACKRQKRDLAKAGSKNFDFVFNSAYPIHVINFFRTLRHYKGEFSNEPFELEPWQQFIIWVVFGWRVGKANGPRRFRTVYIEIPKKNGKTAWAAGMMLYLAFFDNENGAQVYSAATKRDQAKLSFRDAKAYVDRSPVLKKHIKSLQNSLNYNDSFIQPLSNDHDTTDGIDVHAGVVDELHRHKTSEMIDLLEASISARRQPLIWIITTAGSNKESVCYEKRQYTIDVNAAKIKDNTWFGMVYTLDEGDDWREEKNWYKANPNLGRGKQLQYLSNRVQKARNISRIENSVKRYEFNLWTSAEEKWISEEIWEAAYKKRSMAELTAEGVQCYGGLDLASKKDFNAFALFFVNEAENWRHSKIFYWCPKDAMDKRVEQQNMSFGDWVSNGHLKLLPGNTVDPKPLSDDIIDICSQYNVISLAYDPYIATHGTVQNLLKADIQAFEIGQNIRSLSEPTKLLEADILSGRVEHDGNPVTSWMMDNVHVYTDPNENIKLQKEKKDSPNKIDGPAALVFAYAEYIDTIARREEENYDDLEIFFLDEKSSTRQTD